MSIKGQIIINLIFFLISFVDIRAFLYGINRYQLNLSAYKKRKKGESFREWLFYSRFKDEIPRILRILYYSVLLIHPACLVAGVILYAFKQPLAIGKVIVKILIGFDVTWMLIIALLFWSPRPGYAYERWITKKRGQRKGKK